MATAINYSVGVSTAQGIQALQQLQGQVARTGEVFGRLKTAIAGLAIGSMITSLYQGAAAIKDVADASGISTQALLGFQKAVKQFGGDAQGALDGVSKLAQAIDGAANGSKNLQDRFLDLGITLQDLRVLTEEEILAKVVKSLGDGEGNATKMAAAIELFGKKFKNVNFQDVAANIDKYTESQKRAAAAVEAADKAEESFNNTLSAFKSQLLIALQPISELARSLLEMSGVITAVVKALATLAVSFLVFKSLATVVKYGAEAVAALGAGVGALRGFFGVGTNAVSQFGQILGQVALLSVAGRFRLLGTLILQFGQWILKNIPAIAALGVALSGLWDILGDGINAIKNFLGFGDSQKKKTDEQTEANKKQGDSLRDVTDAYKKQREAIDQISQTFSNQNKKIVDQLGLETSLIGKSKEYADSVKAQNEIFVRAQDEIDKLIESRKNLSKEEIKAGVGGNIDKEIEQIKKARDADMARVDVASRANNLRQTQDELRKFADQNAVDKARELQTIRDNINKAGMSELDRRKYDIEAQSKANAMAKIASEEQRLNRKLTEAERQQYLQEAIRGTQELITAEEESYQVSRRASTGWNEALNAYMEMATNAAENSRRVFNVMTQGMEDMLMRFFTTGKLGWKDFANSVIQELMRIEIRKLLVGASPTGGGGILGGIGKLLGFADGGIIPTNGPVIVGERGPELLMGAAGSRVVPNNQMGGGNSITYNISAVDVNSFKNMIAQDPTFLYAVTEQGRRRLPGGR